MKNWLVYIIIFSLPTYSFSQNIIRNYGFEDFDAMGRLIGWIPQNNKDGYTIGPTRDAHTGGVSILIASKAITIPEGSVGLCNSVLTKSILTGKKKVIINAYIKTENLSNGIASIWMQLNGSKGIIADKNCDDKSPKGNSDWLKYSIELPITDDVQSIGFGCKMTGFGKAWFDDFEVLIDDIPLK